MKYLPKDLSRIPLITRDPQGIYIKEIDYRYLSIIDELNTIVSIHFPVVRGDYYMDNPAICTASRLNSHKKRLFIDDVNLSSLTCVTKLNVSTLSRDVYDNRRRIYILHGVLDYFMKAPNSNMENSMNINSGLILIAFRYGNMLRFKY